MLKDVQSIANQTLSLSMMPLEQWAKWTDDSQRQLKALVEQSMAANEELFAKAVEEVKQFEHNTQEALDHFKAAFDAELGEAPVVEKVVTPVTQEAANEAAEPTAVEQVEVAVQVEAVEIEREAMEADSEDDLTRISGVGPALAKKLNAAGYNSFAQIAALSDEAIEQLESTVIRFSGRIARDDWKGQAARFIETA